MRFATLAATAVVSVALAACAAEAPPAQEARDPAAPEPRAEQPSAADLESCNGSEYADAQGRFLVAGTAGPGEINVDELPEPHRIMEPGMAYTMEYNPARLLIEVDGTGRILSVRCG